METVRSLLPFVLPPILGAAIGYVTNYLAIRMLFRPLTEKRILGIRIPFTPGIIPRQRYQLSHSIARMVSQKLLTPDAVHAKLQEPEFSRSLTESVGKFTSDILNRSGGPAGADTPQIAELLEKLIGGFVGSDAFREAAKRIVHAAVNGVLDVGVERLSPSREVIDNLVDRGLAAVSGGPAGEAIRAGVSKWVRNHVEKNTPLHEVVGPQALSKLGDLLPKAYDPILDSLISFLNRPQTRRELAVHGRDLLARILKRLSIVQRFLVSATQYDRNLSENMPAIVADVVSSLEKAGRNPDNAAQIVGVFRSRLETWGETGIGSLAASLSLDLEEVANSAVSAGLELLDRPDVRRRVGDSIEGFLDRHAGETLESMLRDGVGFEREIVIERSLLIVDRWLDRPESAKGIAEQVSTFVRDQLLAGGSRPVGSIIRIEGDRKHRVDEILAQKLREQLELRVPELVEGLDVYGMVVQKIDGLDVESVEQLLLMVIAKHLKWINLFGALLGALIGGIQVLVSRFT